MCRSRRELSNAYLLAKFGLDTAENEPSKVCRTALGGGFGGFLVEGARAQVRRREPLRARPGAPVRRRRAVPRPPLSWGLATLQFAFEEVGAFSDLPAPSFSSH